MTRFGLIYPLRRRVVPLILITILVFITIPLDTHDYGSPPNQDADPKANIAAIDYASDMAREVYHSISQSSYTKFVREFSDIGTKLYGTSGNTETRNWILDTLANVTNNKVIGEVRGEYNNVVGKLQGTNHIASPVIMIGGHYDTVSVSPGANDDGSGVATTLEIARVLSAYEWPLDIYFGFWNCEESGLFGSAEMANQFWDNEIDLLIYYNIDMLYVASSTAPSDERILMAYYDGSESNYQDSQYWAELAMAMANNYDNPLIKPIPSSSWPTWQYSDHYSFLQAGYPNVIFAHESGGAEDTAYHTSHDHWANSMYDYSIATDTTASMAAAIAFVLSRNNQKVYEKHDIEDQSSGDISRLLIPITIRTEMEISTTSHDTSGTVQLRIINPAGTQLLNSAIDINSGFTFNATMKGLYQIIFTSYPSTPDFSVEISYESDIEGDGVPDNEQRWYDTFGMQFLDDDSGDDGSPGVDVEEIPPEGDLDSDGLTNFEETYLYGTEYDNADTDSDGMNDAYELAVGLDPLRNDAREDPDFDGLLNLDEYIHGTLINDSDTDDDLIFDGWEVLFGLDPLRDDASEDPDGDTMSNLYEYRAGYDPFVFDGPLLTVIPTIVGTSIIVVLTVVWLGRQWWRKRN